MSIDPFLACSSLFTIFPARAPVVNSTEYLDLQAAGKGVAGLGRSAGMQAGYQAAALVTTFVIAVVGGALTGRGTTERLCLKIIVLPYSAQWSLRIPQFRIDYFQIF